MSKTNHIKWLYEELPDLVAKGILPEGVADQLKKHYGDLDEKPAYNIAIILAAILGAILIGGGIILLFAHNWDQFSRPMRTALSFAPLVIAQLIYGYVFFKRNEETALVESSAAFLMLMLASCIALISQTYHIQGDFEDFLLVWMLLSIPLMYLMNATLPALFYLVGICSWVMNTSSMQTHWYWLLLLAAVPHMLINMHWRKNLLRARLLGWTFALTFCFAWFRLADYGSDYLYLIAGGFFIAAFYLLGERIYPEKEQLFYKPFQFVTVCLAFILLMVLGYEWPHSPYYEYEPQNFEPMIQFGSLDIFFIIATVLAALTYGYLTYRDWQKGHRMNYFIILFPVFLIVGILLDRSVSEAAAIVLANFYLFGFGLYYIKYGIEKHRLSLVNLGMFFISSLIVARFFDTDWSFVVKGLVFILLGIGFLYVNVVLAKRLKKETQVKA